MARKSGQGASESATTILHEQPEARHQLSLLDLPAEIQITIYELVLLNPEPIPITIRNNHNPRKLGSPRRATLHRRRRFDISPLEPPLTRVSKSLRPTVRQIYYRINTFSLCSYFDDLQGENLRAWLSRLGRHVRDLRHLQLETQRFLSTDRRLFVGGVRETRDIWVGRRGTLDLLPGGKVVLSAERHARRRVLAWMCSPEHDQEGCMCEIRRFVETEEDKAGERDGRWLVRVVRRILSERNATYGWVGKCEECGLIRAWKGTLSQAREHAGSFG